MCTDSVAKIELPITPNSHIMELLIKAKHFFEHATIHAQTGNSFDSMIAIHSLDNSIEYLLRIIIKHLEIEEKTNKTINSAELAMLFGEVDRFLKESTLLDGKAVRLPFEIEIKQLRVLRNNVQHGMILPISELRTFIDYGDRFFKKVLIKIFGLTPQQIAYSTLIENERIKAYLISAEKKILEGDFLPAVVACRDAFELGEFLLRPYAHHIAKMAAIPRIKQVSMELYWYIQSLEQEISMLETNINASDYRLFQRYIDHIPGEYRAIKSGYSVMQREWSKRDADFCYAFVSQVLLNWQLTQEKPLYEVDMSDYPVLKHDRKINEISIPELFAEKMCFYLTDDETNGELMFIGKEAKEKLQGISAGQICTYKNRITNEKTKALFREYKECVIITACDFDLILNNEPLWEFMLYYRIIPFTTTSDMDEQINIDCIDEYSPQNETEECFKILISDFGVIDTVEKAFALNDLLKDKKFESIRAKGLFSPHLIGMLQGNAEDKECL